MNYSNLKTSTQTGKTGGYKPVVYFSPVADITTWGRPVASATPGSSKEIKVAHVFADQKAATRWEAKLHSVVTTAAPVGDEGAQELEFTTTATFIGDNPITFEQLDAMMNDQIVVWVKDADCQNTDYYSQLGDDCVPVSVTPQFDSKNTKEGQKEWKVDFKSKRRLFYNAALSIQP